MEGQDSKMLIDSALVAHSPQISDVSEDMSSAVLLQADMAGSDDFAIWSKLMNLPVPGLNAFHPDSQEMLIRPELSITLRENVHWPCRNSPAFNMFKTP